MEIPISKKGSCCIFKASGSLPDTFGAGNTGGTDATGNAEGGCTWEREGDASEGGSGRRKEAGFCSNPLELLLTIRICQ